MLMQHREPACYPTTPQRRAGRRDCSGGVYTWMLGYIDSSILHWWADILWYRDISQPSGALAPRVPFRQWSTDGKCWIEWYFTYWRKGRLNPRSCIGNFSHPYLYYLPEGKLEEKKWKKTVFWYEKEHFTIVLAKGMLSPACGGWGLVDSGK